MRRKIRFIINPRSGSKSKVHFNEWIDNEVDKTVFDHEICVTTAPGHATQLSSEAASLGFYAVFAVGGDGSVNETAKGLQGSETALGIIPTGSGNGMARHLGIPVDFQKSLRLISHSRIERIDTVSVNEHFCIGTFGIGFDAHIAHLFAQAGTRGYSTYVKLVLGEFYKYPTHQFNLIVDGKSISREAFLLTFANSSQFGNNAVIAPFADIRDGIIEISVVRKFPAYKAPHLIYRMMNNILHHSKYFEGLRGKQMIVKNEGLLKGHIDGEPLVFTSDIRIGINPLSMNVLVAK
ncbi:MAG: diacylglycerol kinase family lipid kinase [Bacteroidia bacterium]|nr:diacylglycerol kinase family lipid kinase [Bacteroidia bacterium]